MPLYAIIGFDHPPHSMKLREEFRPGHRAYVREHGQDVRMAGAFWDKDGNQCGSLFLVEGESAEAVREWFSKEAFCAAGVYKDIHVIECRVAFSQIEPKGWGQAAAPVVVPAKT